jgi:phosphoglycolate phosphatase/beta-phosphoglucomutase
MIQAIFLDFNGVIIDDERLQMAAYQEVLKPHGIALTEEEYFSALGMDDRTFVRATFERAATHLSETTLRAVLEAKTQAHRKLIEHELPLFPGVVTFLKATSRHYALGLVSMANLDEISYVVDRARLRSLFTVIVSAEGVKAYKPAPDCYQGALDQLNEKRRELRLLPLLARECLAIEDSPPGIESACAAGMRTLGVTNTVSENELRSAGADVVTRSLADWTPAAVRHVFEEFRI